MLPVLLAARKLDSEDEQIVLYLRIAYGVTQFVIVCCVLFMFMKAHALKSSTEGEKIVYIPPTPTPFSDPNQKKRYTEVKIGEHVFSLTTSLIGSTLFGMAFTVGLHIYRGVTVGLAMQSVMGPFGLFESPLVKLFFLGGTKVFEEKTKGELTPDDEVVDKNGDTINVNAGKPASKKEAIKDVQDTEPKEEERSFEDILLDTWDGGSEADISPLLNALNASNINFQTSENKWTPLMILSGLGAKNLSPAMKKMKELGADPHLTDEEGWNAVHWAAFHNSTEALKTVDEHFDANKIGLHLVKDEKGMIALDHAKTEGNDDVRMALEKWAVCADEVQDEGLRKRK